jgi:transposase
MRWHGRRVTVYAYATAVDMRKGFDGLCALVTQGLHRDPLSGDVFLFLSRDRVRTKVLHWDGTGLCVYAKRLERGRFARLWREEGDDPIHVDGERARSLSRRQHTRGARRALAAGDDALFACIRSRVMIKCATEWCS